MMLCLFGRDTTKQNTSDLEGSEETASEVHDQQTLHLFSGTERHGFKQVHAKFLL